ncbi:uncharacterized protein LOC105160766 [Sesamum indicum]|uniref:Uncharacterized protein LOC105160766 n=1 Tax=Sesamum indicum TaxID=4182 RepID=A0A6I9T161_SESIN|nr:uncharacterized protein LOC105160766 [Sesamum indicum]
MDSISSSSMANVNDDSNHVMDVPPMPSPPTQSPPIPLHLCGFLTGDTVQVQGDTGELQFSLQLHVHKKENRPGDRPDANVAEIGRDSVQPSTSLSYLTPTSTPEDQGRNADINAVTVSEESWSRGEVVTRLRSGVLSPVKYYRTGTYGASGSSLVSKKRSKGRGKGDNVFEKMLKRRSSPLRPCNAYAFFLMANWAVVKRSSFAETSKKLSKKWYKLSQQVKKEYEDMALKDNARYKRQRLLLKNDIEQETTSVVSTASGHRVRS